MSSAPDADLLVQLLAGQRALDAKLDRVLEALDAYRQREVRPLKTADLKSAAAILPVLRAHYEGGFQTWEVIDHAAARDARGANLRLVVCGRTAQQLGKLFSRVTDREITGLVLRRSGDGPDGALWQCVDDHRPLIALTGARPMPDSGRDSTLKGRT